MNTEPHSVLTVVILFFLGLISPGPNFFVVVETTLNSGRVAGRVTGLGAATGDAIYASCGLLGVAQFIATGGRAMRRIEFLGALYLLWLGIRMFRRPSVTRANPGLPSLSNRSPGRHFWRGLVTDLANPKTVVFFREHLRRSGASGKFTINSGGDAGRNCTDLNRVAVHAIGNFFDSDHSSSV